MSSGTNKERLTQNNTQLTEHNTTLEQLIGLASKMPSTADATATPEDMIYPKTAYVKGQKVTGTLTVTEKPITNEVLFHTNTDYAGNGQLYAINKEQVIVERLGQSIRILQMHSNNTIEVLFTNDTFFDVTTGSTLDISNKIYDPNNENNYTCLIAYSLTTFKDLGSYSEKLPVYIAEFKYENDVGSISSLTTMTIFNDPTAKFLETEEGLYIGFIGSTSNSHQYLDVKQLDYTYNSELVITDKISYRYCGISYSGCYPKYNWSFAKCSDGNYSMVINTGVGSTSISSSYRYDVGYALLIDAAFNSVISSKEIFNIKSNYTFNGYKYGLVTIGDYIVNANAGASSISVNIYKRNGTTFTNILTTSIPTTGYTASYVQLMAIGDIIAVRYWTSAGSIIHIYTIENDEFILKNTLDAYTYDYSNDVYRGYHAMQSNGHDLMTALISTGMYIIKREDDSMIRTSISDANYTYYNTTDATATSSDIVEGKTAYANGEKIEGNVQERTTDVISTLGTNSIEDLSEYGYVRVNTSGYDIPVLFRPNAPIEVVVDSTNLATAISLTPEKILKGNTILNVEGTYEGSGGTLTEDEYNACLELAKNINGTAMYPISNSLVCYYYGTDLIDKSSNNVNGTLYGAYALGEDYIEFNGGYGTTGNINKSKGTFEVFCNIPSNFTPNNSTQWYNCSCIFGCELGDVQQDFGIVIDQNGNFALGYARDTILSTSIKANDGQNHHLVLITTDDKLKLYVDSVLETSISYTMSGSVPTQYGIFWNNMSTDSTIKGKLYTMRYYSKSLSTENIKHNYQCCINGIY